MSAVNIASRLGATYLGLELVSFGTAAAAFVRSFPLSDSSIDVSGLAQDQLPVEDERVRGFKYIAPVHGLKSTSSSIKFNALMRADGTQLADSVSVPATPPWLNILLRGLWGNTAATTTTGGYTASQGCLLAASQGDATTINVASGKGTNFTPGQWILVQTDTTVLEPARIVSISTDALTLLPHLSQAPVSGGAVINMYNFAPQQSHSTSLSFRHAKASDSNQQWQALGCMGGAEFSFERGQLPKMSATLKAATWTGPSALSYSVAAAADTMASPPAIRTSLLLSQAIATTTKTGFPCHKLDCKTSDGMIQVPEFYGTEGVNGIMRIPARPFGSVTLSSPSNPTLDSNWSSQTKMAITLICTNGTGLTQQFTILDFPTCMPVGKPMFKDEGGRMVTEQTFNLMESELCTGSTSDLALAPMVAAYG